MESIREITKKTPYYLTHLLVFCIPLNVKLVVPLIIFLCLAQLFKKEFFTSLSKRLSDKFFLLFISFYIFCVLGYFISSNKQVAGFDLQVKLSLLVLPVFMWGDVDLAPDKISSYLKSFLDGCMAAVLLCMLLAAYKYYVSYQTDSFFYVNLSFVKHPSYFAMELCLAVIICLVFYAGETNVAKQAYLFSAVALLSFFIVLLSSKSGLFSLAIIFFSFLFYLFFIRRELLFASLLTAFMLIGVVAFPKIAPYSYQRVSLAFHGIAHHTVTPEKENTNDRILIWRSCLQVIKSNPLGVGTGDVKKYLTAEYEKSGMNFAKERQFNAHNQYLQSGMAVGIQGLIVLLLGLVLPFRRAWVKGNYLYVFFIALVAFNFLFESMLETQAGVIFYSFFNCILFQRNSS